MNQPTNQCISRCLPARLVAMAMASHTAQTQRRVREIIQERKEKKRNETIVSRRLLLLSRTAESHSNEGGGGGGRIEEGAKRRCSSSVQFSSLLSFSLRPSD